LSAPGKIGVPDKTTLYSIKQIFRHLFPFPEIPHKPNTTKLTFDRK